MNRLLLGLPLYTHVSTNWLIRFLEVDRTPVVDTIAIRKMYLAKAMENMAEWAIKSPIEWDRLVIYEADMMAPRDALTRIANYPDHLDIVGSMYFQHAPPHQPVCYQQEDENHFRALARNQVDHMMTNPGVYPVDAVGFGLTSIHRRVLTKWDAGTMFSNENTLGHDMWFCRAARRQGFSVHVDSGIECGHLTEWPITYQSSREA